MGYQWDQLATMFGQLGIAAKRLANSNPMETSAVADPIAAVGKEPTARPNEIETVTLPEPV